MNGASVQQTVTPISLDKVESSSAGKMSLAVSQPIQTLAHDEYLFREGDPKRHVYRVESGAICITSRGASGAPEFIELAFPGDLIGMGFLDNHAQSAAALVESAVSLWPISALNDLCQTSPGGKERQAVATEREFNYRRHQVRASTAASALDRVAAFLVSVSRLNETEGRDAELISEDLKCGVVADFLGMDVDTLGRSLVELSRRGLISQRANGGLRIDRRVELDRFASA